jgi:pyridinium-3,5-bisthiocarboxylic acid mononucleotide nickel chelatase
MRIAYLDCFSGISGDMFLGALIDSGLSLRQLKQEIAKLPLKGYQLKAQKVFRCGFSGTQVKVILKDEKPLAIPQMQTIVKKSRLSNAIKETILRVLQRLVEAETKIHLGKHHSTHQPHLHELGSQDTIIDIVGAVSGLELLGIDKIYVSPLPLNSGMIKSAHGLIPLPAPATLELIKGFQLYPSSINKEMVTPTGAVLASVLGEPAPNMPIMNVSSIGYGAGSWELTEQPNMLRLIIGKSANQMITETVWCIETNIDNTSPEIMGYILERLRSEGALDAVVIPIQMKKSRPGFLLQVIARPDDLNKLENIIFTESGTLGIRHYPTTRIILNRKTITVKTRYGKVRVKIGQLGNEIKSIAPEYDDCVKLACAKNVPLKLIYEAPSRKLPQINTD